MSIQEELKPKLTRSQSAIKDFLDSAPKGELYTTEASRKPVPPHIAVPTRERRFPGRLKNKCLWVAAIAEFRARKFNCLAEPCVARFLGNLPIPFPVSGGLFATTV
jgi:hypothetical protein